MIARKNGLRRPLRSPINLTINRTQTPSLNCGHRESRRITRCVSTVLVSRSTAIVCPYNSSLTASRCSGGPNAMVRTAWSVVTRTGGNTSTLSLAGRRNDASMLTDPPRNAGCWRTEAVPTRDPTLAARGGAPARALTRARVRTGPWRYCPDRRARSRAPGPAAGRRWWCTAS